MARVGNKVGFVWCYKDAGCRVREGEQKNAKAKQEMADTIEKIKLIDSQQE